jgi:hypothetical protein
MRKICVSAAALASLLMAAPFGWLPSIEGTLALTMMPVLASAGVARPQPVTAARIFDLGWSAVLPVPSVPAQSAEAPSRIAGLAPLQIEIRPSVAKGGTRRAPRKGFRTDRHNNPTAMTTELASEAGLVEGEDYIRGDSFKGPDGKTYYTAKFLHDPIETSIRAMDQVGVFTATGHTRWTYLKRIPAALKWARLTYQEKAGVVFKMYRMEGGSGELQTR